MEYELVIKRDDLMPETLVLSSVADYFLDIDFHEVKRVEISVESEISREDLTWKVLASELLMIAGEVNRSKIVFRYPGWDREFGRQIRMFVGRSSVHCVEFSNDVREGILSFEFESLQLKSEENGWTLGIITSAKDELQALKCADSLRRAFSKIPFELIVVGPVVSKDWEENLSRVYSSDIPENFAPIAAKKNLIAAAANFENILLTHARYSFSEDFGNKIIQRKNRWDILTFKQQFPDGTHYPHLISNSGGHYLSHAQETSMVENLYINGGVFAVKRSLILRHPLNPLLFWNEGEDIEWSRNIFSNGYVPRYESKAIAITDGQLSTNVSRITLFCPNSPERLSLATRLARVRLHNNSNASFEYAVSAEIFGFNTNLYRMFRTQQFKSGDPRVIFDFYLQIARVIQRKILKLILIRNES